MSANEETAAATIKAWRENSKAIRAKLEAERSRLLLKLTEIDEALAEMGGSSKPAAVKAGRREGIGNGGANGVAVPSIRTAILSVVSGAPGLDSDGLASAVRKQRPGVRTKRDSVIKIACGAVAAGDLRAEGEKGHRTYYPAAKAS